MKQLNPVLAKLDQGYTIRTEQFEDRAHIVVPVVILTEGVHCGSAGCRLYTREELARLPQAWNGRPLPVFHPEDMDGNPLSANSPELIQQQSVGFLFNTEYIDETPVRLRSELWIDVEKVQRISPDTLAIIQARKPLEVSTGLFHEEEFAPGIWNDEAYDAVVKNCVPDHLALLPGGLGACSVDDGCGVRANQNWIENYEYIINPFPNEHAARLKPLGLYKRFRRENNKFGSGIHAIWGIKKTDEKVELQAIRFAKSKFTVAQARKWLKDHDYSPIWFEPATGQSNQKEGEEMKVKVESYEKQDISAYTTSFIIADHPNEFTQKKIKIMEILLDSELSHSDVRMNLQREIDKLDNPLKIHFVIGVYDKYFIYRAEHRGEGGESKLYKQNYSVKRNDEVEIGEEVDEVRQVVKFEKLSVKEVNNVADEKTKGCCPEKVQALIDNKDSVYAEEHKEILLALNEAQLDSLQLVVNKEEDDDAKKKIEALEKENKDLKANSEKEVKFEDLLSNAPKGVKESIEHGQAMFQEQKTGIIDQILANENCEYSKDELGGMEFSALKKLSKAFQVNVDYSTNLMPRHEEPNTEEPLVINRGDNGKQKEVTK